MINIALLRDTWFVLVAGVLATFYVIIDQIAASHISVGYLKADAMIAYVAVFFVLLSKIVGHSLIILIKKNIGKNAIARGAVLSSVFLSCLFLSFLLFFKEQYMDVAGIGHIEGVSHFYIFQSCAAALLCISHVVRYVLISRKNYSAILSAELVGNLINIIGNGVALHIGSSSAEKFVGLAVSSLVVQVLLFFYYGSKVDLIKPRVFQDLSQFVSKGKRILGGDTVFMVLATASPFIITLMVQEKSTIYDLVAFSVGLNLYQLLSRPFFPLFISGTAYFLSQDEKVAHLSAEKKIHEINRLSAAILLGVLFFLALFAEYIMEHYYHLEQSMDIVLVVLLLIVPLSLSLGRVCHLRSLEKTQTIALTESLFTYLLGMPLLWCLLDGGNTFQALLYGMFVPSVLRSIALHFLSGKTFSVSE